MHAFGLRAAQDFHRAGHSQAYEFRMEFRSIRSTLKEKRVPSGQVLLTGLYQARKAMKRQAQPALQN
jgi:hypothetical protein